MAAKRPGEPMRGERRATAGAQPKDPAVDHLAESEICPTEQILDIVANKWTVYIIYSLRREQVLRFGALSAAMPGIAAKELTKHLRRLERFGIVKRTAYPEVPPRVEYKLSLIGETLVEPLRRLSLWSQKHGAALDEERRRFDSRAKTRVDR